MAILDLLEVSVAWEEKTEGKKVVIRKEKGGLGECPPEKCCLTGAQRTAPNKDEELFEFFGHDRELQLGFG